MDEERLREIAESVAEDAKNVTPTRGYRNKPLGIPPWLGPLLRRAGYDSQYILAVEIGGRGILHPEIGWISIKTLTELANNDADN